jgi:hypothetical protein
MNNNNNNNIGGFTSFHVLAKMASYEDCIDSIDNDTEAGRLEIDILKTILLLVRRVSNLTNKQFQTDLLIAG